MACLLCNTEESSVVSNTDRKGQSLETQVCTGCGQVFNNPIPSDEELAKFYADDYRKEYKGSFRPRGRQIIRNFRRVSQHLDRFSDMFAGTEKVLDVGAGSGEFVFAMSNAGKSARGIEPNKDYAEYCRAELGVDVETLEILDAKFAQGEFDLINLSHVLEHLNDPVRYLKLLRNWLKDDGILYVEVPNILSYTRLKSKGNMFHYGHIFNFSPWTLRAAARLAGLEECEASAERSKDSTGVFFEKTEKKYNAKGALNAENAGVVKAAVDAHNVQGASVAKRSKFIAKNLTRVEETFSSRRLGTPKKIGNSVLQSLSLDGK